MTFAVPETHPWADRITVLEEVDSTNTRLLALAREGAPEGTVLIARVQTGGKGRRGRGFASQTGGLYLSLLLRPGLPLDRLTLATPMAAVAVLEALKTLGVSPGIKWVNDILLNGKKLCGILAEVAGPDPARPGLVLGIGINVEQLTFPPELSGLATSLALEGCPVTVEAAAGALLARLPDLARDLAAGNTAAWMKTYAQNCVTLGKPITVLSGDRRTPAFARDLGPGGELLVTWADGSNGVVNAGEVSVRDREDS